MPNGDPEWVRIRAETTTEFMRAARGLIRKHRASMPVAAVHSSPVQRARETAAEIAARVGVQVEGVRALDEIDFGAWTGRSFAELDEDSSWRDWNLHRSQALPPGGEGMTAVRDRALAHVRAAAKRFAGRTLALVTHCDVIRAVVAAVLGLSLDNLLRFEVDTASVSRIAAGSRGEKLLSLNERTA